MSKAGGFFHRIIRAIRSLIRAFRTAGQSGGTVTPRGRTAWDRTPPPNPWPRCVACHRRVAALCEEGCGVCPSCCPGEHDDDDQDQEAS